jgi:hypothetical protein
MILLCRQKNQFLNLKEYHFEKKTTNLIAILN